MGMTIEEAKKLEHFMCSECSSDDDMKKSQATFSASPGADSKVTSCIHCQIFTAFVLITYFPSQIVVFLLIVIMGTGEGKGGTLLRKRWVV